MTISHSSIQESFGDFNFSFAAICDRLIRFWVHTVTPSQHNKAGGGEVYGATNCGQVMTGS